MTDPKSYDTMHEPFDPDKSVFTSADKVNESAAARAEDEKPREDDGTGSQNQNSPGVEPAPRPLEKLSTLEHVPGHGPTGDDGRPDGFVPGDQTAAGALTPPGGQHPGEPSGIPGITGNLLDPYNVNGTAGNAAVLAAGQGIENPAISTNPNADKADDDGADSSDD